MVALVHGFSSLQPSCRMLKQSASAVLADSWRAGEVAAGFRWVRSLAPLNILRETFQLL